MSGNCSGKKRLCNAEWNQTCWLIGTFVQHLLMRIEGTSMKTMDDLRSEDPSLSIADSINLHRDLYGPGVDWDNRKVYVRYKDEQYDISDDAEKIAEKWITYEEGFQMVYAFNEAVDTIITKIAGEEQAKRFRNLSALEIVALG
ncbi:MAG: hypothetical protein WED04_08155 [Promethearchaeati archaeon SRVP18_Atabeyarchaeia-1]